MTTDRHFRELRMRLVDLHRSLRHLKGDLELAKATAEQNAIDRNQAGGKNAEERARSLLLIIQHDNAYMSALARLRDCEYEVERCEQLIEAAKDERRAAEWQIRARLADGLFRQQVQSDSADPLGDDASDDVADSRWTGGYSRSKAYETIPEEDLPF